MKTFHNNSIPDSVYLFHKEKKNLNVEGTRTTYINKFRDNLIRIDDRSSLS